MFYYSLTCPLTKLLSFLKEKRQKYYLKDYFIFQTKATIRNSLLDAFKEFCTQRFSPMTADLRFTMVGVSEDACVRTIGFGSVIYVLFLVVPTICISYNNKSLQNYHISNCYCLNQLNTFAMHIFSSETVPLCSVGLAPNTVWAELKPK